MDIQITDDIRSFAWELVQRKNFGGRQEGMNGSKEQQYTGIVGEAVIYKMIKGKLPDYDKFDYTDIKINGTTIDIKTMARTVAIKPNYVHNFIAYQKNHPVEILLFNSVIKTSGIIQICGWLRKEDFLKQSRFFEKGEVRFNGNGGSFQCKAPLYEIENRKLNPINNIDDLLAIR
jgi:hypothetical protein